TDLMQSSTAISATSSRNSGLPTKPRASPGATATADDSPGPPTVAVCLRAMATRLKAAGVDTPDLDGELLLAHVLHVSRTHLRAHPRRELTPNEHARFERLVTRRSAREPLPYLLGAWEFMGMRLRVSRAVLIPRPETEILVE